jgi:hypothetical protein
MNYSDVATNLYRRTRRRLMMRAAVLACTGCFGATGAAEEVFLEVPEAPPPHAAPSDLLDDLQLNELDKADRIDQLQDQLRALRRLLDRRRTLPPAAVPDPEKPGVPTPPQPGIPDTPTLAEPDPQHDGPDSPGHGTLPAELTEAAPAAHDGHTSLFPDAIVDGPIDRLALADSLFAGGQIDLALQTYQEVDSTALTGEERLWIEFQLASCHRRLRDFPEAERRYRQLAGQMDGGLYAAQSRWWLDAMTTRRALEADLQRVSQSLQSLEQQRHASYAP